MWLLNVKAVDRIVVEAPQDSEHLRVGDRPLPHQLRERGVHLEDDVFGDEEAAAECRCGHELASPVAPLLFHVELDDYAGVQKEAAIQRGLPTGGKRTSR